MTTSTPSAKGGDSRKREDRRKRGPKLFAKLAPRKFDSVDDETFKCLFGKKGEIFRGMKNVAAQGEQEQMGVRRRGDRQKQGKPLV